MVPGGCLGRLPTFTYLFRSGGLYPLGMLTLDALFLGGSFDGGLRGTRISWPVGQVWMLHVLHILESLAALAAAHSDLPALLCAEQV